MLCRHRAGQLPIRAGTQGVPPAAMQQTPALRHPSLVRFESALVSLGPGVLSTTPSTRQKPRRSLALPWPSLAQNHLENVANPHLLRRRAAHAQPTPARLLGPSVSSPKTSVNNSHEKDIYSTENFF